MRLPAGVERRLPRATWARLLLAGVLVAFAALAAGYAILVVSTVNAPPAAQLSSRPSLPARTSGPVACASVIPDATTYAGADGPWVVAGGGSGGYVGYRAAEILALDWIRSPNDAVARTHEVEGRLVVAGTSLDAAEITADLEGLRSDLEIRDGHLVEFLGLRSHPDATFSLSEPVELGKVAEERVVDVVARGDLTILETTRAVEFPLQARWNGDSIQVAGQLLVRRSEWGMDVPELIAFRVAEEITIELELVFVRPSNDPCGPTPTVGPGESPGGSMPPSAGPPVQAAELSAWPEGYGEVALVAFQGDPFTGSAPGAIHLLREGATAMIELTEASGGFDDDPAWSSDGARLAYARYPYSQPPTLWAIDADGTGDAEVSASPLRRPSWSPDGRFLLAMPADEFDARIIRVDVSTGDATTLLDDPGIEDGARYSPDGDRIVLSLLAEGTNDEDLYVMDADGKGLTRLTDDPAYEYSPAWSPDGSRIAFVRDGDLWVMRANGRDQRRLTIGFLVDAPTWSPDGGHIAFVVTGGGVMTADENRRFLWVVDADGDDLSRIGLEAFLVARPAWRPQTP